MNVRLLSALLFGAAVCTYWIWGAAVWAEPSQTKADGSNPQLGKLQRQIAELSLQLAQNELQVLVDANERLPNEFPRTAVEQAQQFVAAARQRVELTKGQQGPNLYSNYVNLAAAELKAAESQYRAAQAATRLVRDAVPPLELERLRLTTELTKTRFERAKLAKEVPEILLLSWQIEDLREQVRRLARQVELYRGNE
jgi:hypothetical protein